ncbi:TPA: helix-turn-helix transcriptional regulator [Streptococcus pyogenes]|nr:helix-turn-helix transcriptional regulator [Streptococcus pyogenes]HEQ9527129.1 helix-turn-helix transcriptional regulator [Streptococcus pyogenes]
MKLLRKEKKITQDELAKQCGVSRQTINMIENNKYDPTLKLALALGRVLQEPIESLFIE